MSVLSQYRNHPKDVPVQELEKYCTEIRDFLLENISQTGGHLASNLGVVELTVALHRVLDTSVDRLVFDVGHQSYVHKLLTGRGEAYKSFRSLGGLSGFSKPSESEHDAFISGHASTAVSAALGMARARSLRGGDYHVVALLGDGALTGGLSYEGLCDAGQSDEPIVVILNDNNMSITRNVGAVAKQLARLRLRPQYFNAKRVYHNLIDITPNGQRIDQTLSNIKGHLRQTMIPGSFFEQMGFVYLGPADGHDIPQLEFLLRQALSMRRPVLIHCSTVKGKGYRPAEQSPAVFHGVSSFELATGKTKPKNDSFSHVFGETLTELAAEDKRICAVTAAMTDGTGLTGFARRFPGRFFDVGIAESHAVTMAAGMAKQGMKPVVAVYSSFLQRAYDQILHDVAILGLPVVFAVDRADLVGEDGETHHGLFDTGFLTQVPGLQLWAPASYRELREMLRAALRENGPVAIRYPRGGEGRYSDIHRTAAVLRKGGDATILTYGTMVNTALDATERLAQHGLQISVVKLAGLKPIDRPLVHGLLTGPVYLLEENAGILPAHFHGTAINTGDRFITHGTRAELLRHCGLDAESVAKRIFNDLLSGDAVKTREPQNSGDA